MNSESKIYRNSLYTVILAAILWYLMFIVKPMNFWVEMSLSIACLIVLAVSFKRDIFPLGKVTLRHVLLGLVTGAILYVIFYVGNIVSGYILPFKDAQISMVYGNKVNTSLVVIGLLLIFIIGPGEEIYWRGFIQNTMIKRFGENKGYIIAALLYAAVHITTGNVMLVIAALVCGLYWGWLYKKEKSLIPVIISHALWDLTIFVILPMK